MSTQSFTYTIHQDASGSETDITRSYTIPAPVPGARMLEYTVGVAPHVLRGDAHIDAPVVSTEAVGVTVYTQCAASGLFGHHSGEIDVRVSFDYWVADSAAASWMAMS
ncbi:MAG: hypothetical protein QOI48_1615 [Solirubrobacteraceae bacterium]|jgi:hypothetical protein|nr:hypothetical protein [Solirubrobacteraceae bacterium]